MKDFYFEQLPSLATGLSASQIRFYAEAAVVGLEINRHKTGVELRVSGAIEQRVRLHWLPNQSGVLRDKNQIAEFGAVAIALVLTTQFTDYQVVEQAVIGTGFDFWLGYKPGHPEFDEDNFLNARLEVSGILSGTNTDAQIRLRRKLRQVGVSDFLQIPAIIVIVEFSTPFAHTFVK